MDLITHEQRILISHSIVDSTRRTVAACRLSNAEARRQIRETRKVIVQTRGLLGDVSGRISTPFANPWLSPEPADPVGA